MNIKTLITRHWNVLFALLQLSLFVVMLTWNPLGGDIVDSPTGP
ncbi:MAG: hypothetical protein PVH12_02040 [Candidatus Bathyarchaeota archaeon]